MSSGIVPAATHAASSSGTSSKIVASFNSALGFFLPNRLESRGNFKFCFTSGRPVCSTASLYGRSASRLNTSIYSGTHLCLNTQSHSLAASRAMVPSKHFNNQAWTLSARGKLYGTCQCSISARNINFFGPGRRIVGCCLTAQDAHHGEASLHVCDRRERIGRFQVWLDVDRCSERVNIPF
jgi:hypothetical protein